MNSYFQREDWTIERGLQIVCGSGVVVILGFIAEIFGSYKSSYSEILDVLVIFTVGLLFSLGLSYLRAVRNYFDPGARGFFIGMLSLLYLASMVVSFSCFILGVVGGYAVLTTILS